jgi:NADPH-dependent glutamate synthase beta subunit-like oxidoreductase
LVKGCGVKYLRVLNPYHMKEFVRETRRARRYTQQPDGGVAVIIARYPCITHQKDQLKINPVKVGVRHVPRPETNLLQVKSEALPRSLLPAYRDKTAPCTAACPIQVDARGYITLISEGKFDEALALVRQRNPFPAITGRLCARPCEKACRRGDVDQPIAIDLLKRFIADREKSPTGDFTPGPKKEEGVAIVGSGPTGLMAAHDLRRLGYPVTIFEALPLPGGTMAVATGRFRLPEDVLIREIETVRKLGARFRLDTRVGDELSLNDLRNQRYKAILLAVGAHKATGSNLSGREAEGVIDILSFLKKTAIKEDISVGSRVVVTGGDDRALDAARTALRLGAKEVTLLFNRSRRELPAEVSEVAEAEKEGVVFRFLSVPSRITTANRQATGVSFKTAVTDEPTSLGRTKKVSVKGPTKRIKADLVIISPTYIPDLSGFDNNFPLTSRKTIQVDPQTLATPVDGIFAAGDAVTGPKNFIDALAAGRKVALSIHRYLKGEDMEKNREIEGRPLEFVAVNLDKVEKQARVEQPGLPTDERTNNFREVHLLPDQQNVIAEAQRCLHCGACNRCDSCFVQCPEEAISRTDEGYTIDYEKCTGCRLCFQECPTSAIDMPAVGACIACGYCLKRFECPSLVRGKDGRVVINRLTCVNCGLCVEACCQEAIVRLGKL